MFVIQILQEGNLGFIFQRLRLEQQRSASFKHLLPQLFLVQISRFCTLGKPENAQRIESVLFGVYVSRYVLCQCTKNILLQLGSVECQIAFRLGGEVTGNHLFSSLHVLIGLGCIVGTRHLLVTEQVQPSIAQILGQLDICADFFKGMAGCNDVVVAQCR